MRMPTALLQQILAAGGHGSCVSAGPKLACDGCRELVCDVMERRYGTSVYEELIARIAAELAVENQSPAPVMITPGTDITLREEG